MIAVIRQGKHVPRHHPAERLDVLIVSYLREHAPPEPLLEGGEDALDDRPSMVVLLVLLLVLPCLVNTVVPRRVAEGEGRQRVLLQGDVGMRTNVRYQLRVLS